MYKTSLILILFLFSFPLFAQTDSTNIAFVAYWEEGDSYDYKVTKTKQKWKKEVLTENKIQSYNANFLVLKSTPTSYTIKWSFENDLNSNLNLDEDILKKISKNKNIDIIYKTSETGVFQEIVNWKEVSKLYKNIFDDIIKSYAKDEKGKEIKEALKPFQDIYNSKEGIEQLILKEIQYFHFPMGLEFDTKEIIEFEEEIPNMFGGNPIKANAKLFFEKVDTEEGFCIFKHEMTLDKEDTSRILAEVFAKMNLKSNELEKLMKEAVFLIEDKNIFEYFYYPGIPSKIVSLRESNIQVNNEDGKRIEKIEIELITYD
ncbi:hypothetical protein FLGE108171_06360 [Flavobacterium gelidilacus]|uniref:hypothetical protein n=1 Tax=Flavobacterium gelidilacus TaxID=206041 RepID=UPI0003F8CD9C|nr:hypothetical protein [Flavobacterium gelidilacus]